ncbi:kinase-like protein [Daldinia caldariorum]|uniref:kinase-like protein n=1 Tax=Daldinia caldariorum TaxID=326644 RepID=UPI002007E4D2|nr:kinase-like protein [Daldinia caldariorum]KAI1470129.1 kinase-like protein [Daldinia caldariorum]
MASPSYNDVHKDIYGQIHEKLERKDISGRRFATVGTTQAVLSPYNLKRLFGTLVPTDDSWETHFGPGVTADLLATRIEERKLHNFLAILIYARCSTESLKYFTRELLTSPLDSNGWPIAYNEETTLDRLPATRGQLEQILGADNGPDINSFMDMQPCFCPIVLYGGDVQSADGKNQRLPYMTDEEEIGMGSYGVVYRVVIAKGHLVNKYTSMANSEPLPMARKDFEKNGHFQKELETMKQILSTPRKSRNIVETFGSLQLNDNIFSLFMPLAECDLRVWMRNNPPPILDSEKADILGCMSGLADGLEFLHSEIKDSNGNRMVCYHMDLKPANILVFYDKEHGKMVWKISDFGMSRVKVSHNHTDTVDRDISVLFDRRRGDTSVSGTVNRRLEGTYLAPESSISVRNMNEKSDIWSLGCVIDVVITYISEGQGGIDTFADERATVSRSSGAGDKDHFFLISRSRIPKPHPAIKAHHKHLIKQANFRNPDEGKVMKEVLNYIEEKVLELDPKRREPARRVRDELLDTSAAYRQLSENSEKYGSSTREGIISSITPRWWKRRQHQDGTRLESWWISDSRAVSGYAIASTEPVIAYWTDTRISLYDIQYFQRQGENKEVPSYEIRGSEAWRSVKLNGAYLIASITGRNSHIYLFDIKGGRLPGLNFDLNYKVELPVDNPSRIGRIAISPGGKVLACVVPRDLEASWIYHARISDLIDHKTHRGDSESTISSDETLQYMITAEEPWDRLPVDAPAGSITHLSFSSDTALYCVTQPDISEKHDIKIYYVSLLTKRVRIRPVENPTQTPSGEIDSGNWGRLLTGITVVNDEPTFAVVLYENQLRIRNFGFMNQIPNIDTTIRNYFIGKLIINKQKSRLFALASKSGNSTMLLVELPLSHLGDREKPQEIKVLPDLSYRDKVTAMLFNEGNEGDEDGGYIIILAYVATRLMLYKISLSKT